MREEFFNTFGYIDDELSQDEMNEMLWEDEIRHERKAKQERNKKQIITKNSKKKKHRFW